MKGFGHIPKLPIIMEKIVAGAAVTGCVVLALRTVRLISVGAYLAGRKLKGKSDGA